MYDDDTPQPEDSFRDMYELGLTDPWPPTDAVKLAELVTWSDEQDAIMADVSFGERCGSQFAEEVA